MAAKWGFFGYADADGDALQAITLNTVPYTVIAVMPDGFRDPDAAALWTLFQFDPSSQDRAHNFEVVARLKDAMTVEQATAAMDVAAAGLRRTSPGLVGDGRQRPGQ